MPLIPAGNEQAAVLFATDIAARGLDFPAVNWVVQADCPDDVQTYIHRAGRTARLHADGKALLVLAPSEVKMIEALEESRIPLEEVQPSTAQLHSNPNPNPNWRSIPTRHGCMTSRMRWRSNSQKIRS